MLLKVLAVVICAATFNIGLAYGAISGDLEERYDIKTAKWIDVPYKRAATYNRITGE